MEKPLEVLESEVRNSNKSSFRKTFIEYCEELIKQKGRNNLSVEEVGYRVVSVFLPHRIDEVEEDLKRIFDIASEMEISRNMSYKQRIDEWDEKVADKLKNEEWSQFLVFVKHITN